MNNKPRIINIGTIGHIDHGKTTLSAAINNVIQSNTKTLKEIMEESKLLKFEITNTFDPFEKLEFPIKESRSERRKRERKTK